MYEVLPIEISILGLSRIHLEDDVVTKLEWQTETRFVPEEDLGICLVI